MTVPRFFWVGAVRLAFVILLSLACVALLSMGSDTMLNSWGGWSGFVLLLALPVGVAAIGCAFVCSFRRYVGLGTLSSVILGVSLLFLPSEVDEEMLPRPVASAIYTGLMTGSVALTAAAVWGVRRLLRRVSTEA